MAEPRERTLITIAHRADHVVVLERGHVVDEGPPQEVLERYREGIAGALSSEG